MNIVHVKIQHFVISKSDQDPDPHWFSSLDPDLDPHRDEKLDPDPDPHLNKCGLTAQN
jgi:hypothetical protein